jgi:alanine-glyoxylate transaminase/serine-glyoxylate transaminase/serine-pyruvate transaminase
MDRAVVDHRSDEFAQLLPRIAPLLKQVFGTKDGHIVVFSGSGTGAWESAMVNTLKQGDCVLCVSNGHFGAGFGLSGRRLGFEVQEIVVPWGAEVPADLVEERLKADKNGVIKAVLVVHNETSTGVTSDIGAVRQAMNAAGHDALLIVDAVSSLASMPFEFDEWGVDVALCGSQKGLMLPPGQAYLCASGRALEASKTGGSPRNYFEWGNQLRENITGKFPYTPNTLMLFGLREALIMLVEEEGLDNVYARHRRMASGVWAAVEAWGLKFMCHKPRFRSTTVTTIMTPEGVKGPELLARTRNRFNLVLGTGIGDSVEKAFRMGHLGALNELEVIGMVAGVEMALHEMGAPVRLGSGVAAAEQVFSAA